MVIIYINPLTAEHTNRLADLLADYWERNVCFKH